MRLRAHKEHPIAALQSEYSLWSRNAELGTLAACKELGIAYVAFSPMGRAFFSGKLQQVDNLVKGDIRATMPRFAGEAYAQNLRLLAPMQARGGQGRLHAGRASHRLGAAPGQHVIALPGTTSVERALHEDIRGGRVHLDAELLAELDDIFKPEAIAGDRYALQGQGEVDTEKYAFEKRPG